MTNPLVSIIISTYNRAHLIGGTLDSIMAQTYSNWECIIVDDGSTDHTMEVLKNYSKKDVRFQYHNRPKDRQKGANACRNYGFELSKGAYINWFDDDDVMVKDKLSIQVEALRNSAFNFSVCQTLIFEDELENIIGLRHNKVISENSLLDFIKLEIVFLTPSALIKSKFIKDSKLKFDEELQAAQEWEFFCRLLYYSPTFHATDLPLVLIRRHSSSISYDTSNRKSRKWFYYLARQKVFIFLKNKQLDHKNDILDYLKNYFRTYLKSVSFHKNFSRLLYVFFKGYVPFNGFFKNLITFSIVLFIFLTGRGYKLTSNF